jgi:hypothetical protein
MKWLLLLSVVSLVGVRAKKAEEQPDWAKKDIKDYTDADMQRLLDQWEEDDDPIPADELPDGHPDKPQPQIDLSKLDMNNPESVMQATKKGKTVMMFARVTNFVDKQETEEVTSLWQTGLFNNHVQAERFLIEDDRVMFMFTDGALAWEAKEFLLEQERCDEVQLEQQTYYGKYSKNEKKPEAAGKGEKKGKKKKSKGKGTADKVEL